MTLLRNIKVLSSPNFGSGSSYSNSGINIFSNYENYISSSIVTSSAEFYKIEGFSGSLFFSKKISGSVTTNTTKGQDTILYLSSSNNNPKVGIGFNNNENLTKTFDIKSLEDTSEGTEIVLRSGRPSDGALQIGDLAGQINFVAESGSYFDKYSSGSLARIKSTITSLGTNGAQGNLVFELYKDALSSKDAYTIGYGADPENLGSFGQLFTGSIFLSGLAIASPPTLTLGSSGGNKFFQLKATGNNGIGELDLLNEGNSKINLNATAGNISASGEITTNTLTTITTVIGSDAATDIDTFNTSSYNGAIYDYILLDTTVGARTGQFMVIQDNGNINYTDTSLTPIGGDASIPELSASFNGANTRVQVINGNGYTFKSFVKKI